MMDALGIYPKVNLQPRLRLEGSLHVCMIKLGIGD
jgi:hypothetical protein